VLRAQPRVSNKSQINSDASIECKVSKDVASVTGDSERLVRR
jgi:hypothetical protein